MRGEPGTPGTHISRWWIGECSSEMRGRREIKYLPWTKQTWQWAAAFAITNCRWKSRRLVQLQKETLWRGTHIVDGVNSSIALGALGEAKAREVNHEKNPE